MKKPIPSNVQELAHAWGTCTDAALLEQILASFPHAVPMLHSGAGTRRCQYPLWDARPDALGRWVPAPTLHDEHRLVCGAPTTRTEPPYCDQCHQRTTGATRMTRSEHVVRTALLRRQHMGADVMGGRS